MNTSKLHPAAHHPLDGEFKDPDMEKCEITHVEQLLRVAYAIGGKKDGEKLSKGLLDHLADESRNQIEKVDIKRKTAKSQSNTAEKQVEELIDFLETKKKELAKEKEENLQDLHRQVSDNTDKAISRLLGKEQASNKSDCSIRGVKIVDLPFTSYEDKKFVATGHLVDVNGDKQYTRSELEDHLQNHGGTLQDSVTTHTDYLIIGSNPGQTKQDDARKNHTTTIGSEKFLEIDEFVTDDTEHIYGKNDVDGRSPDYFGYEYPFKTFAVIIEEEYVSEPDVFPFIPWYGVTMCTCMMKTSVQEETLCPHEIYALIKESNGEFNVNGEITVPNRFKRLTNTNAYNEFTNNILPQINT